MRKEEIHACPGKKCAAARQASSFPPKLCSRAHESVGWQNCPGASRRSQKTLAAQAFEKRPDRGNPYDLTHPQQISEARPACFPKGEANFSPETCAMCIKINAREFTVRAAAQFYFTCVLPSSFLKAASRRGASAILTKRVPKRTTEFLEVWRMFEKYQKHYGFTTIQVW